MFLLFSDLVQLIIVIHLHAFFMRAFVLCQLCSLLKASDHSGVTSRQEKKKKCCSWTDKKYVCCWLVKEMEREIPGRELTICSVLPTRERLIINIIPVERDLKYYEFFFLFFFSTVYNNSATFSLRIKGRTTAALTGRTRLIK